MDKAIRNAIARVDVVDRGRSVSRGTAFLVAPHLALTAFHVVADRDQSAEALQLYPGQITLTFPTGQGATAHIHDGCFDRLADWVLLRCDEPDPEATPLELADLGTSDVTWESFGFPDANPRDGLVTAGAVRNHLANLSGVPAFQLFSSEAGAGQGAPVKGFSGAPVFVQDSVVGLLRFALMAEGRAVAGTLYACPIGAVVQRCPDLPSISKRIERPSWSVLGLSWIAAGVASIALTAVLMVLFLTEFPVLLGALSAVGALALFVGGRLARQASGPAPLRHLSHIIVRSALARGAVGFLGCGVLATGLYAVAMGCRLPGMQAAETWTREERRLPVTEPPSFAGLVNDDVAQARTHARARKQVHDLCVGYTVGGGARLVAESLSVDEWRCSSRDGGRACGLDGKAVCQIDLRVTSRQICPRRRPAGGSMLPPP